MTIRAPTSCLATLLLVGCGDPLTEEGFRGAPLYTFSGRIAAVDGPAGFEHPVQAALFWSPGQDTAITPDLVEQQSISVAVRFPGDFEINIFEPPLALYWHEPDAPYRLGLVLIYEDVDHNGRYTQGELRGGARNQALLYVRRAIPASQSPTGRALSPGFTAQRLPMACHLPESEGEPDCGVPLGDACSVDTDCGAGGVCVTRDRHHHWAGGYCLQPHDRQGCVPSGGVKLLSDAQGTERYYWHLECETSADCRQEAGYACNLEHGACLPADPVALVLDPNLQIAARCAPDDDEDEDSVEDD